MSTPEPMNPYDSPDTVKPGMSGGSKVLLGLGIGCGVLVLLCCGGLGISGYFFGRSMQQAMSTDPNTIQTVADSIVAIEVPEPLSPAFSMDFTIPFVNRKAMTMVIYAHQREGAAPEQERPDSTLMLFQMNGEFANREVLKAQFESQLQESGREDWEEVRLESEETIEHEVNGSPAQFTFGKGKREEDGREVWQGIGAFDGKGGPAMLFMQLDAEDFTEEQARATIDSMH